MPFIVIVALLLGGLTRVTPSASPTGSNGSGQPLAPVTVSPPPSNAAAVRPCTRVIGSLPLQLAGLNARSAVSNPSSPFIVAWGQPAIVLRCGVDRPSGLTKTSSVFAVDGVNVLPRKTPGGTVFTVIDRPVYLDVTVPASYAQPPLGPIARVVARTLPQVCTAQQAGQPPVPAKQLCVNRR